jgi:hypothetical protein
MVVNFRAHKINQGVRKLIEIPILIKKKSSREKAGAADPTSHAPQSSSA